MSPAFLTELRATCVEAAILFLMMYVHGVRGVILGAVSPSPGIASNATQIVGAYGGNIDPAITTIDQFISEPVFTLCLCGPRYVSDLHSRACACVSV